MSKQLVHEYTFDAANSKITIDYIYKPERFLLISNVTDGKTIYIFNDVTLGANISYDYTNEKTILTLTYDCSEMGDNDKLQIFVEKDNQNFEPSETFVDPVSKFRISQPENLIDTDFEYGLQSTKWETLELVKNIPTFFARNGDVGFNIVDITTVENSDTITVTCGENHNLLAGSPVIVSGTTAISCDGTFVVTAAPSSTIFRYKSKSVQNFTGSIFDSISTQVFPGSRYQGTEFTLENIDTITTDESLVSNLTITTEFPTNFVEGTSFYLTNSLAPAEYYANASLVEPNLFITSNVLVTNNTATGENGFSLGAVQPYDYTGTQALYFLADVTVNVNTGVESITFPEAHGLIDNQWYLYVVGEGNTGIGGLTSYVGYVVRVIDSTSIYLTTAVGSTTRVNLTSQGVNGGVMRSAFLRGYRMVSAATSSSTEYIEMQQDSGVYSRSIPLIIFNGTAGGGMAASSNLFQPTVYYIFDRPSATRHRFSTSPTGGLINMTSTSANGLMVPATLLSNRDSMYIQNHGINTGDAVKFLLQSGTAPSPLTSGTTYQAQKVDDNRIQFLDPGSGALLSLGSIGTAASTFRIVTNSPNLNNDTIYAPGHGLTDGTSLIYSSEGSANIGGLQEGQTYYSFLTTTDRFKLSNTFAGWDGAAKTFTHSTTYVNPTTDVITLTQSGAAHGYSTGDFVQYTSTTPLIGLKSGAFYYVRALTATTIQLHYTYEDAVNNVNRVDILQPFAGTGSVRKANLVDLTSASSNIHSFTALVPGAADGVYRLTNTISSTTFLVTGNAKVKSRILNFSPQSGVDLSRSAFYYSGHSLTNGTSLTYSSTENAIDGLTSNTTYYVNRISRDWFKLSDTLANVDLGETITLGPALGSGTHKFETTTISGEIPGQGTVTIANNTSIVTGVDTNFTAVFTAGDRFNIFKTANTAVKRATLVDPVRNTFVSASHNLTSGAPVYVDATVYPGGVTSGNIYYANANTASNITLHLTYADALSGANQIDITTAGTNSNLLHLEDIGSVFSSIIDTVNGVNQIRLNDAATSTLSNTLYSISTGLYVRADGFAIHRPYDGGVELIPSKNPDSSMIRQTRKYFRYQSGKGIQISFAVNFSPSTSIDNYTYYVDQSANVIGVIQTRYPHRLSSGGNIHISGANVSSGTNYWNGDKTILSLGGQNETDSEFYYAKVALEGIPDDSFARGSIEYYLNNWTNSLLKCGLFDDQNGLYFEYNGQELSCCRRSSVSQISGTVTVEFKSGLVVGNNTKFLSQLVTGDNIVIKGQTYKITEIISDTILYILPSYRGISATNVIVTRTIDTKVSQSNWNIDKCDGTGPSGFVLDIHKIQMAYMDYSWYGAGKVRFGFKDQRGKVIYVHEFIHNNKFTEAYMRSGNLPARYEIENVGQPSYVPALAHWGTSVIMDGRFDDDKAYVFTASSQTLSLSGSTSITASARVETISPYYIFNQGQYRFAGYALLSNSSSTLNQVVSGMPITGTGLQTSTLLANPSDTRITQVPYQPGVTSRIGFSSNTTSTSARTLLFVNKVPTTAAAVNSAYPITISTVASSVNYEQPLISIRLAPSVDNGSIGELGSREIINRMQLILSKVGILSTHAVEVSLRLNGTLNNYLWERVQNPSLSQLVYHTTEDRITGGTTIYSFRAQGGAGTTARTPVITAEDLGDIATLGNSIMGGDNVYPDGPDILTVVVKLVEDPSTVSGTNPFVITGRISWSESQA